MIALAPGIACLILFSRFGHDDRRRPFWQELGDIWGVVVMMAILDAALAFLTKTNFSRLWWGAHWTLAALPAPSVRYAVKQFLMSGGAWIRSTLVVGVGPNAQDTARALQSEPLLGFEVTAFIRPANTRTDTPVTIDMKEMVRDTAYVEHLSHCYGDIDIVSPMRGLPIAGTRVTHFFTHDVLALRLYNNLSRPWQRRIKRCLDLVVGTLLLSWRRRCPA